MAGGGGGSSNKKQVEKQYKQDKAQYEFQNQQNLDKYNQALAIQKIDKANAEAARDIKNQTAADNWKYQMDLKDQEYQNAKDAYEQGLKDYDTQTEFNSAAAAVSKEAEQRKLEEAIINANFSRNDADLDYKQKKTNASFNQLDLDRQKATALGQNALDRAETNIAFESKQADLLDQKKFTKEQTAADNKYAEDTAAADIDYTNKKAAADTSYTRDTASADIQYTSDKYDDDKTRLQADNFNDRINQMTEKFKAQGAARASGVEGNSAARQEQSALAAYGRSQAQLVDSLVMGNKELTRDKDYKTQQLERDRDYKIDSIARDRDYSNKKTELKRDYTIASNNRQKNLKLSQLSREMATGKSLNQVANSKLDVALANTQEQIRIQSNKIKSELKFDDVRNQYSKDKTSATVDSAKKAKKAADSKIALDEYAANLAAHGKIPSKPKYPVSLPVPLEIPEAQYPVPTKPQKGPKPIKGAYTVPNTWDHINAGANMGLSILSVFA